MTSYLHKYKWKKNTCKLKQKTTPGPDRLTSEFIQILSRMHKILLLKIFNAPLQFAYFPEKWKPAKLILIPKNSIDSARPEHFRPICITSILGKVLQKQINSRQYHFLYINKILNEKQYGFTQGTSAVSTLENIKALIQKAQPEKLTTIIISLDIAGAFYSLWTPFALGILNSHRCPQTLYNLLKDLLSTRTINYETESGAITKPNVIGCPQGPPISPLLCNLLISTVLNKKKQH